MKKEKIFYFLIIIAAVFNTLVLIYFFNLGFTGYAVHDSCFDLDAWQEKSLGAGNPGLDTSSEDIDLVLDKNTDLCAKNYLFTGQITLKPKTRLNCNGALLQGDGKGVAIIAYPDSEIINCRIRSYDWAVICIDRDNRENGYETLDMQDKHITCAKKDGRDIVGKAIDNVLHATKMQDTKIEGVLEVHKNYPGLIETLLGLIVVILACIPMTIKVAVNKHRSFMQRQHVNRLKHPKSHEIMFNRLENMNRLRLWAKQAKTKGYSSRKIKKILLNRGWDSDTVSKVVK